MSRRVVLITILAALAVVVVLRAASAEPAALWSDMDLSSGPRSTEVAETPAQTAVTFPPREPNDADGWNLGWVLELALVLAVAALLALVLWWLSRRDWRRRPRDGPVAFEELPEIELDLTDAAEGLDDVLARGSPRNAIVACWVGLEDAVEQAGLRRDPTETSEETATRVLRTYTVDHDAIVSLAGLYREARFSVHDLDEAHREQARAALAALREQLRANVTTDAEVTT